MGPLMSEFPHTVAKLLQINQVEICVPTIGAWGIVCVASAEFTQLANKTYPSSLALGFLAVLVEYVGSSCLLPANPFEGGA